MNSAARTAATPAHLAVNQAWLDQYAEAAARSVLSDHRSASSSLGCAAAALSAGRGAGGFQDRPQRRRRAYSSSAGRCIARRARMSSSRSARQNSSTAIAAMSESGAYGATRVCEAIVGYVDLRLGDRAKGVLEKHLAVSDGRLRGIRNIIAWHENPEVRSTSVPIRRICWMTRDFAAGFVQLGRLGLVYDCWLYQNQLADLARFAKAFPETTIVDRPSRRAAWGRALCGPAPGGVRRVAPGFAPALRVAEHRREDRWPRHADKRLRFPRAQPAAVVGRSRQRLARLRPRDHHGLRDAPLHAREQFSGRQGFLQLRGALERVQAVDERRISEREGRSVPRHGGADVPAFASCRGSEVRSWR